MLCKDTQTFRTISCIEEIYSQKLQRQLNAETYPQTLNIYVVTASTNSLPACFCSPIGCIFMEASYCSVKLPHLRAFVSWCIYDDLIQDLKKIVKETTSVKFDIKCLICKIVNLCF